MKQNPSNLKPGGGLVLGQPFDPQVSANYRIPGLVYHNGMLVASADVRLWFPALQTEPHGTIRSQVTWVTMEMRGIRILPP